MNAALDRPWADHAAGNPVTGDRCSRFRPVAAAAALVLLAACDAAPAASAATPSARGERLVTLLEPSVVEVAPGVRLLGETLPNASYVIEAANGLALVDTCAEPDARPILEQMAGAGLDIARLRWIFLTHAHGDHSLGARRLREVSGARVHAGRADAVALRAGAPRTAFFSVFEMPFREHAVPVDVELDGGEILDLGGARVRVLATPGHTPGSVCYLLERDATRFLFTGDAVISLTDDDMLGGPGIYSAYLAPAYGGDAEEFVRSLRVLRAMPSPDYVLPGHPRADPWPQDPRIRATAWETLLARGIGRLETLLSRRRADGADFLDGQPKELLPGLHYWGDVSGRAIYALSARPGALVIFGAPETDDPAAFVAQRCRESRLQDTRLEAVVLASAAPSDLRGLADLVRASGCAVVAPRASLDAVRELCPEPATLLAAEDLPAAGWFPVEVVDIAAPGSPEAAYVLRVEGKRAVVTGRYPVVVAAAERARELRKATRGAARVGAYLRSLDRLDGVRPDLWLPLVPFGGRNANVYDDEWAATIDANRAELR